MEPKKLIFRIIIMALFLVAILFTVRFFTQLFSGSGHPLYGDGNTIRKEIRVEAPFTSLKLEGSLNAFIRQHPVPKIEITGDSNLLEHINIDFDDDELTIRQNRNFRLTEPLQVMISIPDMHKVIVEGASEIDIRDTFRTKEFFVKIEGAAFARLVLDCEIFNTDISGAGEIRATGKAGKSSHIINGAGKLEAREMLVQHQEVEINGAGNARVTAQETLDATIHGAGVIEYSGKPQITKSIKGIGKIKSSTQE